jgi:hypothetical protein
LFCTGKIAPARELPADRSPCEPEAWPASGAPRGPRRTRRIAPLSGAGDPERAGNVSGRREVRTAAQLAEVAPDNARVRYQLASVWARDGKKGKALKALRQAVERGFSNLQALESDPAFDSLRKQKAYRKMVEELAARSRRAG